MDSQDRAQLGGPGQLCGVPLPGEVVAAGEPALRGAGEQRPGGDRDLQVALG